jgi:hypothetical protein
VRRAAVLGVTLAVALAVALVASLLGGCTASQATRTGADRLAGVLGHPAWTTGVDVGSGLDGQSNEYVATVVSLKASATAQEVADFVVALPAATKKAGLQAGFNYRQLTFVSADGARLNIGWSGEVASDALVRGAQEWLGVGQQFGGGTSATLLTSGPASYVIDLGAGAPSAVVTGYQALAGVAQPDSSWELTAKVGDEALDLKSAVFPTAAQLTLWTTILDRLRQLPEPLEGSRVDVNFEADRTVTDLAFTLPDSIAPDQITLAVWGDRLWPVFRPQLAAMAGLTGPWSCFVSVAPRSSATSESFLISLLSDQATVNNGDEAARWSKAAQEYVQSLGG